MKPHETAVIGIRVVDNPPKHEPACAANLWSGLENITCLPHGPGDCPTNCARCIANATRQGICQGLAHSEPCPAPERYFQLEGEVKRAQETQIAAELEAEQTDASWREVHRLLLAERAARLIDLQMAGEVEAYRELDAKPLPEPLPLPRKPYAQRDGVGQSLLESLRSYAQKAQELDSQCGTMARGLAEAQRIRDSLRESAEGLADFAFKVMKLSPGMYVGTDSQPRLFGRIKRIDRGTFFAEKRPWWLLGYGLSFNIDDVERFGQHGVILRPAAVWNARKLLPKWRR